MAKKQSRKRRTRSKLGHFKALRPYIARVAIGRMGRHHLFSMCVRASLSKCFEFNISARSNTASDNAFFAISSLRGICEDLIVLRYIKQLPVTDRETLIIALSDHEMATRIKLQDKFFAAIRPQQPVLRIDDADARIQVAEVAARDVWNRHGWPNLKNREMPQIRQIAEKQGVPLLLTLYDYLYRLTSSGVHFSIQSLLRSGWGPSLKLVRFSPKNFRRYFSDYCSVYGAFMFCLYFEFFGSILRPGAKVSAIIAKIREELLFTPRWPEMVTFEEMNLKPPDLNDTTRMIVSAFQAVARKRLVSRGIDYTKHSSAETRLVRGLLKLLAKTQTAMPPAKKIRKQRSRALHLAARPPHPASAKLAHAR